MAPSLDEVAASEYGLIAEAVRYPADFSWVSFRINPAARWHDGKTVSSDDVIFSLEAFKRLHPLLAAYYRHVVGSERIGESEVKFAFDEPGIRELPQVLGQLHGPAQTLVGGCRRVWSAARHLTNHAGTPAWFRGL